MTIAKPHIQQTNPPGSPRNTLPTMYDLPSEHPEEPGLPDEYHLWQAELLSYTIKPPTYPPDRVFTAIDLNLYAQQQIELERQGKELAQQRAEQLSQRLQQLGINPDDVT
ncbi:hypothetical protein [Iningainema tapete]|uniref:Uma2 family endonuclease n=1 Tax=Iningainema tapete BLCC-T55 TaxID=2748662 RepID=A0A8J6XJN0_9CYAN|nr:hypothetical protein [Iningainema tapete]MBD2773741.1 hypothetical protein [Iningainema tapete BLCC-T55]